MNAYALSTLKRMTADEIRSVMPFIITVDNDPLMVCSDARDVIVIGDMHPLAKTKLRNMAAKIRKGMPPVEHKSYSESREEFASVEG